VSNRSGAVIGVLGLVLAVPGTIVALNELGTIDIFPRILDSRSSSGGCDDHAPAEVTLSTGSAARGAAVTVYGACFEPGERVVIRVHVTEVGSATADSEGAFTQTITVPESAPAPGFPTEIAATGRSSIKTGSAPFATASG
jgi:hypothetical protein